MGQQVVNEKHQAKLLPTTLIILISAHKTAITSLLLAINHHLISNITIKSNVIALLKYMRNNKDFISVFGQ